MSEKANVRLAQATPGELLGAQLAMRALPLMVRLLHSGGYRVRPPDLRSLVRRLRDRALGAGEVVIEMKPAASDDELDHLADELAGAAIVEVMGPPPVAH